MVLPWENSTLAPNREEVLGRVERFLSSDKTSIAMVEDLRAFVGLDPAPEFASASGVLVDNVRERLRFAKRLRDMVRGSEIHSRFLDGYRMDEDVEKFELNLMQLAACLFTDFDWTQDEDWTGQLLVEVTDVLLAILAVEGLLGTCEFPNDFVMVHCTNALLPT